jgi:hypothetical protein
MEVLLAILIVAAVAVFVTVPLRRAADGGGEGTATEDPRRAELEARKEAKYREIRDAELDYRTGKLSEADFKALDRTLRAEAIEILKRLDQIAEPLP